MKNRLLRLAPAIALAAPIALGLYARPAAQTASPTQDSTTPAPATQGSGSAASQQPAQTPTFRTDINFVRVDVIVADKQGNPVGDLRQQDFDVTEDGKPQTIQTFKLINIRESATATAAEPPRQIRSVIDEESEAAKEDVRLFAVFLDDYHVRKENSMRAREPIARFIEDQLLATDMAGIMYPLTPLDDVLLTRNRANLASAIRSFIGRKYDYTARNLIEERYVNYVSTMEAERIRNQVTLSALKGLIVHLGGLREGRKSIVLVSEGYTNSMPAQAQDPIAGQPGSGGYAPPDPVGGLSPMQQSQQFFAKTDMLSDLRLVYEMANRYNTTIYTVDPRGLANFEFDLSRGNVSPAGDSAVLGDTQDTMRILASETDGRAIVNQNDLDAGLRQITRDSSAYYLIGYSSTQNAIDGKFHQISVKVKRPNVQVRARKGYLALSAVEAERVLAPPKPGPPKAISDALGTLVVGVRRSLIRSWIGMSPGSNGKTKLSFVWEPMPPPPGVRTETPARVSLVAGSANSDLYFRGKVPATVPTAPGCCAAAVSAAAPLSRVEFEVPPGPLDLDIAIEDSTAQVLDRETRKLVVPSLGLGLTMSTPQVFRAGTVREWQTLASDANAMPLPEREFRRTDHLLIRVGAQSAGGNPTVTARLLNRDGGEMTTLAAAPAAAAGLVNIDAPLANLSPGEFLIEINATDGADKTSTLIAIRITG
jgi:VWFA-related protein